MNKLKILGIKIIDRIKEAGKTQIVLSRHSEIIHSRIGFHELNEFVCSRIGYVLLELCGDESKWETLISDLENIGGLQIQQMLFEPFAKTEENKIVNTETENQIRILGILIDKKQDNTEQFQYILTKYGCSIKLRVGINFKTDIGNAGVILLELVGDTRETIALQKELHEKTKVLMQKIVFD